MSTTNFARLQPTEKVVWSKDLWAQARNESFIGKFLGTSENSVVQRVTELRKTEKGTKAIITLVADLVEDGVAGDSNLKGNGEEMEAYFTEIRIDQLRHYTENQGRVAEQKSVVSFREQARNKLAYWLSDRIDQMAFLTMAGISYAMHPSGYQRVNSNLPNLEFAADITAPSANRFGRFNATSGDIEWGNGSNTLTATDYVTYKMLVDLKAYAKNRYIRGIRESGGEETYHVFLSPLAMARLKKDPDYIANLRYAAARDMNNPLFTGTSVKIDGLFIHEFRHVPNTWKAASGSKYGASGTVDGCTLIFAGAQALGFADLGDPDWIEEEEDFGNRQQIATGKIIGFKKPVLHNIYEGSDEDFGVIVVYVAQ